MASLFHILTSTIINPPNLSWLNSHILLVKSPRLLPNQPHGWPPSHRVFLEDLQRFLRRCRSIFRLRRWRVEGKGWKSFSWYLHPTWLCQVIAIEAMAQSKVRGFSQLENGGSFHSKLLVYQRVDGFSSVYPLKKNNDFTAVYSYQ